MKYYLDALKKYKSISGRATRKDYWMFVLFNIIVSCVISVVEGLLKIDSGILGHLYTLFIFVPNVCLGVRRFHDVGKSGWWWFSFFVPFLNFYTAYLLWFKAGTAGINKYGAPAGTAVAEEKLVYGAYSVPVQNDFASYNMCPVPQPRQAEKCSYCGQELEQGAKFCSECGAPVNK